MRGPGSRWRTHGRARGPNGRSGRIPAPPDGACWPRRSPPHWAHRCRSTTPARGSPAAAWRTRRRGRSSAGRLALRRRSEEAGERPWVSPPLPLLARFAQSVELELVVGDGEAVLVGDAFL